jgi:glyoxylase-like metal-dependent hydrolase (beta-lactamase superfamily II)
MEKKTLLVLGATLLIAACSTTAKQDNADMFAYKMEDFKIISLNNNTSTISSSLIGNKGLNIEPYKKDPQWNANAINYFLIDTGVNKILVDTGLPENSGGKVTQRLREAGLNPRDIDTILLTHMHGDHIGGMLNADGEKVFPNAKVYVGKEEAAYWGNQKETDGGFKNARQVMKVYSDKLIKFEQHAAITPQITSVPLFGHTPGHSGFFVESKGKKLLIWGDLIHAKLQFANPDVYLTYDIDPVKATLTRKEILAKAADKAIYIAGMHLIKPAMGRVSKAEEGGYKFKTGM